MTLAQLESEVSRLSPHDLAAFMRWMGEFIASQVGQDAWDSQIVSDSNSGKLNTFIDDSIADIQAGMVSDL